MCSSPRISFSGWKSLSSAATRLPMFLARSPIRSRSVATRIAPTISRRSTAIGWRRAMVSTARSSISALQIVDLGVGGDHALAERDVAADQRVDGIDDHALGKTAHLRDQPGQFLQIAVERLGGMFRSHRLSPQPNRPVM